MKKWFIYPATEERLNHRLLTVDNGVALMYAAAAALNAARRQDRRLGILYAVALLNGKFEEGINPKTIFSGIDIAKVADMACETASREMSELRSSGKAAKIGRAY